MLEQAQLGVISGEVQQRVGWPIPSGELWSVNYVPELP